MSKPKIGKRKLQEELRVFNEEWELQFYVVAVKDKMMCLLCNSMISTMLISITQFTKTINMLHWKVSP